MPISSPKNITKLEYKSPATIQPSENTAASSISIILFVANQLGTNFNASEEKSTAYHAFLEPYIYQGNILA